MKATLYGRSDCPFCRTLSEDLRRRGVETVRLDVDRRPELIPELLKLTGGRRIVPVLVEGSRIEVAPSGGTEF